MAHRAASKLTSPPAHGRLFLNVENSVTGRAWRPRLDDDAPARAIAQTHDLPDILGRVLAARAVTNDEVERYLTPSLRALMPDPDTMTDMAKGVMRIAAAVKNSEKIAIFGDFDVDGAASSALFKRYLDALDAHNEIYIPDRLAEGYGPNEAAFQKLVEGGARLIVTVDCGIAAHDPVLAMHEHGVDVVVIDHHLAGSDLPRAEAVINPNRSDDLSGLGALAATGVVFMALVALNRQLRADGFFSDTRPEPDLMQWLDLVALATVCDVVPLTGLNRAFVAQGLKIMSRRQNPGLTALADVAGLKRRPDTQALGFLLGPRINAGGRLGASDLGALLLSDDDPGRTQKLASSLDQLNKQRRDVEQSVASPAMIEAEAMIGDGGAPTPLVVSGKGWHPGVLGIVASRLKERFMRPAIVIGFGEDGLGTGSGRSVPGVDLGRAIRDAVEAGILVKGGGHAMAAGLTVKRDKLGDLRKILEEKLTGQIAAAQAMAGLKIDGALNARAATLELMELLERAGPYGAGNPVPRFVFPAHRVIFADYAGEAHVRCTIASQDGARLKAIAFRAADTPLGKMLLDEQGATLHIAGTLARDDWGGRQSVQLFIDDAAKPV